MLSPTPRLHPLALSVMLSLTMPSAWAAAELQGPEPISPTPMAPEALPRIQSVTKPPSVIPAPDSGARILLRDLRLEGCQALPCERLIESLQPLPAVPVGLSDFETLAQRVADLYKQAGYPFVQVVVPPQRLAEGVLTLRVVEGRLGKAVAQGSDPFVAQAQPFLDHGMPTGRPIQELALERTLLLLDDQPGFAVHPVIRPGSAAGEGDLLVDVERRHRVSGDMGIDNTGNRNTGRYRVRGSLAFNSPFRFGDRLVINALGTDEHMWLGALDYDAPLGVAGWRGQMGVARTSYQLGGAFSALGAKGLADTGSLKVSYPLVRSQVSNLTASAQAQYKKLEDSYDASGLTRHKTSRLLVLNAQFDHRDNWATGGVTYGQVSLTSGKLVLDSDAVKADALTARTAGDFAKANLDVARIQRVADAVSVYVRLSAQWASGNLDSSEKYGLGGFLGVRAYPMGEASGDTGWLAQSELRMASGAWTGFVFMDAGRMKLNAQPWDAADNFRSLAGAGVGLRWGEKAWSLEATLARRLEGGVPQSESDNPSARLFVSLTRRFN